MSFLKKHYEKILLGAVLLGLVGSLLFLPVIISAEQQSLKDKEESIIPRNPRPLPALDMTLQNNSLGMVQSPVTLDFDTTNRLFNSMQWEKAVDGHLIKIENGTEVGPGALKVTGIEPLYFVLRLDGIEPANQFSAARYQIGAEHQGAATPGERHSRKHFLSVGDKDETLHLVSVSGPPDAPQLKIEILGSGESVTVSQTQPYQEVEGYEADLTYPPENKNWRAQRVGALLKFNNNDYNIVVIDQNEVVISAESNQKRTTVPYQP